MGADGGINWMRVKNHKRFWELVMPLGFHGGLGDHEDDHDAYINKHPELLANETVIMTYGSFNYVHGFSDLRDLIHVIEAEDNGEYLFGYDDPKEWTFCDYAEEIITSPWWGSVAPYPRSVLERLLFEKLWLKPLLGQNKIDEIVARLDRMKADPILRMTLKEWAREVKGLLDWKSFGEVETWT